MFNLQSGSNQSSRVSTPAPSTPRKSSKKRRVSSSSTDSDEDSEYEGPSRHNASDTTSTEEEFSSDEFGASFQSKPGTKRSMTKSSHSTSKKAKAKRLHSTLDEQDKNSSSRSKVLC